MKLMIVALITFLSSALHANTLTCSGNSEGEKMEVGISTTSDQTITAINVRIAGANFLSFTQDQISTSSEEDGHTIAALIEGETEEDSSILLMILNKELTQGAVTIGSRGVGHFNVQLDCQ